MLVVDGEMSAPESTRHSSHRLEGSPAVRMLVVHLGSTNLMMRMKGGHQHVSRMQNRRLRAACGMTWYGQWLGLVQAEMTRLAENIQ